MSEPEPLDFPWFLFYGLKMGLTKEEVAHITMGDFLDLFEVYKESHNMDAERKIYTKPKKSSLLSL